jgi:peptidoglycan/xylan/chitin deacetylase (PgdA/CDA1 family)
VTTAVLMYHDVTPPGREDSSGFAGGDAARYKLTPRAFAAHLAAIAGRTAVPPTLTFDDGGQSAAMIADLLESRGWRGHFFVTTAYIGRPAFLTGQRIRELHARGHTIGSHSHTHPLRMAKCSETRLRDEWTRSTSILADVIGAPVVTASVPGGHYSSTVARTAGAAGITLLFTSRPTRRRRYVGATAIVGRYPIQATTSPQIAAALVAGDRWPRLRWAMAWTTKQACRQLAGPMYLRIRARLLGASDDVRWGDDVALLSEDSS